MFENITINLSGACRHDKLNGRDYLVVPMIMLTEGVHNGSSGRLYYSDAELKKTPAVWNHKPIVVYHPTQNGQGVSACSQAVLEKSGVGLILNTRYKKKKGEKGKLHAEAWVEVSRLEAVDDRVLATLEADEPMELSTGLFTDNEMVPGEWEGEEYDAIARNFRPDHLALLPDTVGACSIADGAGFLRCNQQSPKDTKARRKLATAVVRAHTAAGVVINGMSYGTVTSLLSAEIRASVATGEKEYAWVEDVYDDFVVYMYENSDGGTLYKQAYAVVEGQVTLVGEPIEVRRETKYVAVMPTANQTLETQTEVAVDKKQIVDGLIANTATAWVEADRDFLMKQDDAALAKFAPVANAPAPAVNAAAQAGYAAATPPAPPAAPVVNAAPATPAEPTMEQYIAAAPAQYRQELVGALTANANRKQALITEITSNAKNGFSAAFLATKCVDELEGIAALGRSDPQPTANNGMFRQPNYGAAAGAPPVTNAPGYVETPLPVPSMSFEKAK